MLSPQSIKNKLVFETIPEESKWMCNLAIELLDIRNENCKLPGFSQDEIEALLCFACTS